MSSLRHPPQVDSVSKLMAALHLPSSINLVKERTTELLSCTPYV